MRVPLFLQEQRVPFETIIHPPAFTAQKRAKYLGIPGRFVVKAVLLAGPEEYLVAVLPATHHVDTAALAAHLGGPVRLAEPQEMADLFMDCEFGVVPSFGSLYGVPTVIDDTLDRDGLLVFEGHTHAEAFRLRCRDFERLTHAVRLSFARP
jgi:Ala-tRNA(Pro) deacylase